MILGICPYLHVHLCLFSKSSSIRMRAKILGLEFVLDLFVYLIYCIFLPILGGILLFFLFIFFEATLDERHRSLHLTFL